MGAIYTRSGRQLDLLDPSPASIELDDIAHALGSICRFAGHTRVFYSVAEHSIMVSHLVPEGIRLRALLHDATEAYIQDIPSPLKRLLPEYQAIEARVWSAIARRFGLPVVDEAADAVIKHADAVALRVEMRDLFRNHPEARLAPRPPQGIYVPPQPLSASQAAAQFRALVNVLAEARRTSGEQGLLLI